MDSRRNRRPQRGDGHPERGEPFPRQARAFPRWGWISPRWGRAPHKPGRSRIYPGRASSCKGNGCTHWAKTSPRWFPWDTQAARHFWFYLPSRRDGRCGSGVPWRRAPADRRRCRRCSASSPERRRSSPGPADRPCGSWQRSHDEATRIEDIWHSSRPPCSAKPAADCCE